MSFQVTGQIRLQAPKNASAVARKIAKDLGNIKIDLKVDNARQAQQQVRKVDTQMKSLNKNTQSAARSFLLLTKRFAAFNFAARVVSLFTNKLSTAIDEAIKFEREINRISQVTGKTMNDLRGLSNEITRLSTTLGTSSTELAGVGRILSQAGFKAQDLTVALRALAKTDLAPTFENIAKTAEGAVAIFNQFGQGAAALETQLGAINAVAGKFAVESSDLIGVISRVGGVFSAAGGQFNELLALFTSVRATTRESAESIATGLRTILTRIQRPRTIGFLKELGVELTNVEGKFVGPFQAIQALGKQFETLEQGDLRFVQIAEELGGFRQIGKVIPLIQQYKIAQDALNVATNAGNSLDKDAKTAQQSLAVQIAKVREEYLALVRSFTDTTTFRGIAEALLLIASSTAKVIEQFKEVIPLITAFAGLKVVGALSRIAGPALKGAAAGGAGRGGFFGFNSGGLVPGSGNRDTVPAMLTPGEFVMRKSSVQSIGAGNLARANKYAKGGEVTTQKLATATGVQGTTTLKKRINATDNWQAKDKLYLNYNIKEVDPTRTRDPELKREYIRGKRTGNAFVAGNAFEAIVARRFGLKQTGNNDTLDFGSGEAKSDKNYGKSLTGKRYLTLLTKTLNARSGYLRNFTPDIDTVTPQNKPVNLYIDKYRNKKSALEGKRKKFATGGGVTGGDTVPALLTPGEFVINKKSASRIGLGNLNRMNRGGVARFNKGGPVQRFQNGGAVGGGAFSAGFDNKLLIALTLVLPAVNAGLDRLLDSTEDVTDAQFKTTIATQKMLQAMVGLTTTFLLFRKIPSAVREFNKSVTEATKRTDKREADRGNVLLERNIRKSRTEQSLEGRKEKIDQLLKDRAGFKQAIVSGKEQAAVTKAEEDAAKARFKSLKRDKGVIPGTSPFTFTDPALIKARDELIEKSSKNAKAERRLQRARQGNKKTIDNLKAANKRAANIRKRLTFETLKAAKTEKKLAIERRRASRQRLVGLGKKGLAFAAGGAGIVGGIALAIGQIGSAITSTLSEFAGRDLENAKTSNNVAGVAEASRRQGKIDEIGRLFTVSGLVSQLAGSFFDPNFAEKQRKALDKRVLDDTVQAATSSIGSKVADFGTTGGRFDINGKQSIGLLAGEIGKNVSDARRELAGSSVGKEEKRRQELALQSALVDPAVKIGETVESLGELDKQMSVLTGGSQELKDALIKTAEQAFTAKKAVEERAKADLDLLKIRSVTERAGTSRDNIIGGFQTGSTSLERDIATLRTSLTTVGGARVGARAIEGIRQSLGAQGIPTDGIIGRSLNQATLGNRFNDEFNNLLSGNLLNEGRTNDFLNEVEKITGGILGGTELGAQVQARISKISQEGTPEVGQLSKLAQEVLQESTKGATESLNVLVDALNKHTQTINKLTSQRRQAEERLIKAQIESINQQVAARKIIEEFGGRKLTGGDRRTAALAQFNLRADDARVGRIDGSPGSIRSAAREIFQSNAALEARRRGVGINGGNQLSVDEDRTDALRTSSEALVKLTKDQVAILRDELKLTEQRLALEKTSVQSLLSGDAESFFNQQGAAAAAAAIRSGDSSLLGALSGSDIAGGVKSLQGQLSGRELESALVSSNALSGIGLGRRSAQLLAGTTAEEEAIKSQARQLGEALGDISTLTASLEVMNVETKQVIINAADAAFRSNIAGGLNALGDNPVAQSNLKIEVQPMELTLKVNGLGGELDTEIGRLTKEIIARELSNWQATPFGLRPKRST